MRIQRCASPGCEGIRDDRTELCAAHRRAIALTTEIQDAVRRFLHQGVVPTGRNEAAVTEAGKYFAEGLAVLVRTLFGSDVNYDNQPITLQQNPYLTWRVLFSWTAALNTSEWREETRVAVVGAGDAEQPC